MKKKFELFIEAVLGCLGEIILLAIIAIFMAFWMTGCENPDEGKESNSFIKAISVKEIDVKDSKEIMDLITVKFIDGHSVEFEVPNDWTDIRINPKNNKEILVSYDFENFMILREYDTVIEDFKITVR